MEWNGKERKGMKKGTGKERNLKLEDWRGRERDEKASREGKRIEGWRN